MTDNTRQQFLQAAKVLFADKGFYGASIAAIARELGLTKQALLHHFGSKEKLYGEVLAAISAPLLSETDLILGSGEDPREQLTQLVLVHYRCFMADRDAARLIMRELLDNEERAEKAGNWYMKPTLDRLVDTALAVPTLQVQSRPRAVATIYQLLGAAHYFAVSQPTLSHIFGEKTLQGARDSYEEELRLLVAGRLGIDDVRLAAAR